MSQSLCIAIVPGGLPARIASRKSLTFARAASDINLMTLVLLVVAQPKTHAAA